MDPEGIGLTTTQALGIAGTTIVILIGIVGFFVRRFIGSIDAQATAFSKVQENNDKNFRDIQGEIASLAERIAWMEGHAHKE
jgi:hypothetical protein